MVGVFGGLFPKEEGPSHGVDPRFCCGPVKIARPQMRYLCRVKAALRTSSFLDEARKMWQLLEESSWLVYPGLPPSGQA